MRPIAALPTKSRTDSFWFGCRKSTFADKHKKPTTLLLWPFSSPTDLLTTLFPAASIAPQKPYQPVAEVSC